MSIDDDAQAFGRHFEGSWKLGLYVARNVHKQAQAGRPQKSEQVREKVSCSEFAEKAGVSERTVQLYYDAWQLAAKEGHCTSADQLKPGDSDPLLKLDDTGPEQRELWRKFYRQTRAGVEQPGSQSDSPPTRRGGGGHRGPLPPDMKLRRVKALIENIDGLQGEAAEKQTEICRLIDQLLDSIKPSESNSDR